MHATQQQPTLIIGSGGRLGGALLDELRAQNLPAVGWNRQRVDLSDAQALHRALAEENFHNVVISGAMTSVDACEKHPAQAQAVNVDAPGIIAHAAAARGGRCLFVSTDYVYDGSLPGAKTEASPLLPLGVYARTKLAGELAVLAASPRHLVARTSWIFGPHRPSFVDQLMAQVREPAAATSLQAIADKFSAPSYSLDLATAILQLLHHPGSQGTYNVVNQATPDVSWHTLAEKTLELAYPRQNQHKAHAVARLQLAEMRDFQAPRPIHTCMDTTRLAALLGSPLRPWQDALAAYLQSLGENSPATQPHA